MENDFFEKINSIKWTKGIEREEFLISIIASSEAVARHLTKLGIKNQQYQLCIGQKGWWTIFRPDDYFNKVLISLDDQLEKMPQRIEENLERLRGIIESVEKIDLPSILTEKQKIDFLHKIQDLLEKYFLFYIYNNFLGFSIEKFNKKSQFLETIIKFRDTPVYPKIEKLFEKFIGALGLSQEDAKFYTFKDVLHFIEQKKKPDIRERRNMIAVFCTTENTNIITKDVPRLRQLLENEGTSQISELKDSLRGAVAFKGKVIGRVVVAKSVKSYQKIKKDDILVTTMTRPDLVAYLKLVKAIITDEGGITCHAAIVSRELGIPCIIGTKHATQTLKDGDRVEVGAEQGIVKIIK